MRARRLVVPILFLLLDVYSAEAAMPIGGANIYYIVSNTILKERISTNSSPEVVFDARRSSERESSEIYGLTLGPSNTLLFHMVTIEHDQQAGEAPSTRSSIYAYDLSSGAVFPYLSLDSIFLSFASVSADGKKLAVTARDSKHKRPYVIIRDYVVPADNYFDKLTLDVLKIAWSPDGGHLFLSGINGKNTDVVKLDVGTGQVTRLFEGILPIPSKGGKHIAFSSPDRRKLIVSSIEGKVLQEFGGHLIRDIYQWVDDKYVMFSVGKGFYVDEIMLADLGTAEIYTISNRVKGEISGCVLIEHR